MIKIDKPYITTTKDSARVNAKIHINNQHETLWYEIPIKHKKYLVTEVSDAFVVALLYVSASLEYDIKCEQAVSEPLLFQLNNHLLPIMCKQHNKKTTHIIANAYNKALPCENKVGTGYSAGVDCFYSIMKHLPKTTEKESALYRNKLDTICVIDVGVFRGEHPKKDFDFMVSEAKNLAKELNLESLYINSNLKILPEKYSRVFPYRIISAILSLQKYFSCYLLASWRIFAMFELTTKKKDSASQDLLTTQYLSTKTTHFISCGSNSSRIDKIIELCEFEPCYSKLKPCARNWDSNCCSCRKCREDIVTLDALGKLEKFRKVFDLKKIRRQMPINIAYVLVATDTPSDGSAAKLLKDLDYPIPQQSYKLAKHMKIGFDNYRKQAK